MNGSETTTTQTTSRGACLVVGCHCKDARILSHRRAAYVASLAIANGQTANRIVPVEAGWRLPAADASDAADASPEGLAA
ncbi:MAG TPA: hypothetical protein VK871_10390 [Candidatus Limnocylindrales bacterium]|nr:hypothetical protein [Candidatus Limnocylindrales bacterium]